MTDQKIVVGLLDAEAMAVVLSISSAISGGRHKFS